MMQMINPWRGLAELHRRGLRLGSDGDTNQAVFLPLKQLETHLHLLGPPGTGKTRLLLHIFQCLCELRRATVIVLNPKGDFGHQARDAAIAGGLSHRLVWFDPGEPDFISGYNPLRPNGLPAATHAKAVREAIRAGWGQASFDSTPQLARLLFLLLFTARELQLDLVETLALLRSPRTPSIIQQLRDDTLRAALVYFWSLSSSRRDELAASALARLESFVLDPTIRSILTAPAGLQLDDVLREHKILIINLEQYRPLRTDDVKLMGRFIINDILSHVFARPPRERTPVYLLMDEVQTFATMDLCTALDQGRELKLHCVLAHQHLGQLRQEDASGQLFASVMQCARTKLVFGGLSAEDLDAMAPDLFLEEFDPWTVKDELTSLELEPIESRRASVTSGGNTADTFTQGENWGEAREQSEGHGETFGRGINRGTNVSKSLGMSRASTRGSSHGWTHSWMEGQMHARSRTESQQSGTNFNRGTARSSGHSSGSHSSEASGETLLPSGDTMMTMVHDSRGHSEGDSVSLTQIESFGGVESRAVATGEVEAFHQAKQYGVQDVLSESETNGEEASMTWGSSEGSSETMGLSHNTGQSHSRSESESKSRSRGQGASWSQTINPFHEYKKRRVVSSRTFLSQEEFFALKVQRLKQQRTAEFVLKRPTRPAQFVRAPRIQPPMLTDRRRQRGLARVFSAPYYTPRVVLPEAAAVPATDLRPEDFWEESHPQLIPLKEVDDPNKDH
jgi:hypothetical protein